MSHDENKLMIGTQPAVQQNQLAFKSCKYIGEKPPLPNKKKQSVAEKLFVSPFVRKKRKGSENMGQTCTKKVKVEKNGILSPRGKSNKVQPSPFKPTTLNIQPSSTCPSRLSILPHSNFPSRLSMTEIALQGQSTMVLERVIPEEGIVENNEVLNTRLEKENSLKTMPGIINEEETLDLTSTRDSAGSADSIGSNSSPNNNNNNEMNTQKRYSLRSSTTSTPTDSPMQGIRGSVPNLRPKYSPFKKVNRSCSHGDVQLKKNFGCTDLLNKAVVIKPEHEGLPTRHHSVESVTFEKRRRKAPTKENGIHNLDADQVNYYQIMDEIGRGSFGAIYKCHCNKDNKYYAMKIISKKRLMRKNGLVGRQPGKKRNPLEPLHREIAILKKMDHPNIVKLVEVMNDLQVDDVYMVFELMKNGVVIEIPTQSYIQEERARRLFRELLLGIEYLHYSKIIHRDIKPSNLLLDDNDHIKIADFGVSDMFEGDNDLLNKFAGSPAFQSPEALNHDSRDKYSGKAVDVWAMGITLFCFLYGKCPFYSESMGGIELINKIKNDQLLFPEEPTVNPQAQDLISRMLSKDPKERITVLEMKEHPWVTEGCRTTLPSTEEHCRVIEVTDEEVRNSVKIISKLSSLVFAKSILKKGGRWWNKRNSLPSNSTTA